MDILIVCHAGDGFGLGHLTRVLAVTAAIKENANIKIKLLIQGQFPKKNEISLYLNRVVCVDQSLQEIILEEITSEKPKIIIFDIHPKWVSNKLTKFLKRIRSLNIKIVGIDSLAFDESCDMGHVPSFCLDSNKIQTCGHPVYFGWDSYLLPKPKIISSWKMGNKILVLTGGSDIAKLGNVLPKQLDENLPLEANIHWVKGPFAASPAIPQRPRLSWTVHHAPNDLDDVIANVNFAITVFGVSFFELLRSGIPTVVYSPYGNKDNFELEELKKENVAVVVQNIAEINEAITNLMLDEKYACLLSQRAKEKIHPDGAGIIAQKIQSLLYS